MKAKFFVTIMIIALIVAGAGGTYYFYDKYTKAQFKLDNPELTAQSEVNILTDKLGKLIELPTDEEPTVATVLDKEKLKDQGFFVKAENGDKVIIYSKSRKAILYRESMNKIIEVAPIDLAQPEATSTPKPKTASPEPSPEI